MNGFNHVPKGFQNTFEQQEQNSNPNPFPPLLLDALGGGKRPGKMNHSPNQNSLFTNQSTPLLSQPVGTPSHQNNFASAISPGSSSLNHHRSRSQRSRSRERSLTPGIFGSPSSTNQSNPINDIDAPPTMMLMDTVASSNGIHVSRQFKPLSLNLNHTSGDSNNLPDFSPGSAMSVDAKSSLGATPASQVHRTYVDLYAKSPSTPASLSNNGSTVTFIGFPSNKRGFVLDLAANQCGPIYHIKKPEKPDSNWLIVTFLNKQSAERALQLDGVPQEGSWVLCVKRGDTIGALSSNIKAKPKMESPRLGSNQLDDSSIIDSPLLQMKNNKKTLLLDESALSAFSTSIPKSDLSHKDFNRSQTSTSNLYPSLSDSTAPSRQYYSPNLASPLPSNNFEVPKSNINGSKTELDGVVAKPVGLLTKVADFLFGW